MGDEGSAYDIGRQALQAAAQAFDGRGPDTLLLDRIPEYFDLLDLQAVQEALHSGRLSRVDVASLAKVTAGAASEQDTVACAVFDAAAASLAGMAIAAARCLSWTAPQVSIVGGVFKAGSIMLDPFMRYLVGTLPEATVAPPRYPPVLGALLLALEEGGCSLDQMVFQHLDRAAEQLELSKE
jgi:N-acetylglucosamine kinase-like BadF-type ATPase